VFPDQSALADLDQSNTSTSGFYLERPGPAMDNAQREAL